MMDINGSIRNELYEYNMKRKCVPTVNSSAQSLRKGRFNRFKNKIYSEFQLGKICSRIC